MSSLASENLISGIQQVGIGVKDAVEAFEWYNRVFGLNVPVFDDVAEAKLMVNYTNGIIRKRRAILAINMAGGGGAEIWESKNPLPLSNKVIPKIGDLGIFALKIKCQNVLKFCNERHWVSSQCLDVFSGDNTRYRSELLHTSFWFLLLSGRFYPLKI